MSGEEGVGIVVRKDTAEEKIQMSADKRTNRIIAPVMPPAQVAEVPVPVQKVYTEEELHKMNEKEQDSLIRQYDNTVKIPKHKQDRIQLLLKYLGINK